MQTVQIKLYTPQKQHYVYSIVDIKKIDFSNNSKSNCRIYIKQDIIIVKGSTKEVDKQTNQSGY